MDIKYMFLLKRDSKKSVELKNLHYEILNGLFVNVNKKSFEYKYEDKEYNINYSVYYNKDVNMFKLILTLEEDDNVNTYISAAVLEKIDKLIRKGRIRKDYNIIISNDEVSEYYSNKIHKFLNRFERKLRELVYIIMVKTYGVEWYEKTVRVNQELHGNVKRTVGCNKDNTTELIEKALQNMTLHDLEMYLFNPYSELNFNELFNKDSFDEYLTNSKSKDDILSMISSCIPRSLWERFFKDIIDIEDIQEKVKEIRKYRNKVAHYKDFYNDDYICCKDIIEALVKKINLAIEKIETKEFYEEDIKYIYNAFIGFTNIKSTYNLSNLAKAVEEAQSTYNLSNLAKAVEEAQSTYNLSNLAKAVEAAQSTYNLSNLAKAVEEAQSTYNLSNLAKAVEEAQSTLKLLESTVNEI